jgi:hypothetical protein
VIAIAIGDTLADVAAQGVGVACLLGQQLIKVGEVRCLLQDWWPKFLNFTCITRAVGRRRAVTALIAFLPEANEAL